MSLVKWQLDVELRPDGYNVGFNAGAAAGQTVMHLHVHVIPRFHGDMDDPRGGVRHVIPSKGNYLHAARPLATGGADDPFAGHVLPLFDRAEDIAIVAAFVQASGLERIQVATEAALRRGAQVRVITGDYLNITSIDALETLQAAADQLARRRRRSPIGPGARGDMLCLVADEDNTATLATVREGRGEVAPRPHLVAGDTVGRYIIEAPLGQGGMGVVYTAVDPELARKIAIKLVRPGGGAESQTRLLREAQAMARLSHPNVVAIYDVGVYDQRVFLAMELVAGETVRRWLRATSRSWREVLTLFRGAARGLAAAHDAGIVHRDFKLDNVLVDADGRARVTDFGLARAVEETGGPEPSPSPELASPSALDTPLTETGAVLGTPAYMAPEQRSPSTPADARADEFSFCVSLYEALYGERPFADDGSLRAPSAAAAVPTWLRRVLVRGLAKEPAQRWPSMQSLLDALEYDPGRARNRIAIASVTIALIGAVTALALRPDASPPVACDDAGTFEDTWNPARREAIHTAFIKTGKPYAQTMFATITANLDRRATAWKAARRDACRDTRVRHVQSEEVMLLRMACLERQRAKLRAFVDLLAAADGKMVERAAQAADMLGRPEECANARALDPTANLPADPKLRAEIESLRVQVTSTNVLAYLGRPQDAITRFEGIVSRANQIAYRPLEAEALYALALAHTEGGDPQRATDVYQRASLAAEAGHHDWLSARIACRVVANYAQSSRFSDAKVAVLRARALLERIGGDRELDGELAFAEGVIALNEGRPDASIEVYRRALQIRIDILGADHVDTLKVRTNLGAAFDELARGNEAIEQTSAAIDGFERTLGPDHPRMVVPLANLGFIHLRAGDRAKAKPLLTRAYALGVASVGPTSYRTAVAALYLSYLDLEEGRVEDAIAHARESGVGFRESSGPDSEPLGAAMVREGAALLASGNAKAAVVVTKEGIALRSKANPDMLALAEDLTVLGQVQLAVGEPKAALTTLERALELSAKGARYPGELATTRFVTAQALVASQHDHARAIALARQARDELASLPHRAALRAQADAFLAHHTRDRR